MAEEVGLDFGTTNSTVAVSRRVDGGARADSMDGTSSGATTTVLAEFPTRRGATPTFRSVLYFGRDDPGGAVECKAGPEAIERYLEVEEDRRLMQSLKSFLASRLFQATSIYGRNVTLEELVGRMLRPLREQAEALLSDTDVASAGDAARSFSGPIVVGRPVRFAKAKDAEDDLFAVARLQDALTRAGWSEVQFEYEPVAAAYHYEQSLEHDELVLIADFGGGTSDFCLLNVGPTRRATSRSKILGTVGVAIAGDAFDAKIVRQIVAPRLGKGSFRRSPFGSEVAVPKWLYSELERWHHLSFLRSRKTLGLLYDILGGSQEPEKICALLHVVESDLGFQLYRSVERTKRELSTEPESWLLFDHPPAEFEVRVTREEFEGWISEEIAEIERCVARLLDETGISEREVDRVFMTGGSSFVPAVRRIFETRFGSEKLRGGDELVSVASGLSLRALDLA